MKEERELAERGLVRVPERVAELKVRAQPVRVLERGPVRVLERGPEPEQARVAEQAPVREPG